MHGGMAEGVHTRQVVENILVRGQGRGGCELLEDCPNRDRYVRSQKKHKYTSRGRG